MSTTEAGTPARPWRDEELPATTLRWLEEGRRVAVATVLETWGSAPRPVGSQLVVDDEGRFAGSVSGGCVEGAVIAAAAETMEDGRVRMLEFGVRDEEAWAVGLACGGRVRVHVRREERGGPVLRALVRALDEGRPAVVAMALEDPGRALLLSSPEVQEGLPAPAALRTLARVALREDRSRTVEDRRVFLRVHNTPLRLIVVGAVHIAQPLARMARHAGMSVVVVDPRAAFATPERFPGVRLFRVWPAEALAELRPDARTAVVTLSHDPKLDDPALVAALDGDAFYVGALGSRRTHERRLDRLAEEGVGAAAAARIHAPVGLDIGARTPEEIAVAILGQVVAVLRRPPEEGAPTTTAGPR